MNRIYLDNAATTPLSPEVLEAMMPYLTGRYGNASSIYDTGRDARRAIDDARKQVAGLIGAKTNEIHFTSGGTESDNWALKGIAFARRSKGNHIITSAIEHHAVLETARWLETEGFDVTYLPVSASGIVNPEDVKNAIKDRTILISIMAANNEIGTLQPVEAIGAIAREHKIPFHSDAVQAAGAIGVDVNAWQVDLLSLSGHKFHGPKGTGALYVRSGTRILPLLHGGAQERNRRAGTENVAGIVGLGKAAERAGMMMDENAEKITRLRNILIDGITGAIPHVRLNGDRTNRLPNNANLSFRYIEGEALLLHLDLNGIAASSGSACASGSLEPSHVLLGMGLAAEDAHSSLRFTLSEATTHEEINTVLAILPGIVDKLRAMSPLAS
ncbi:MAG: cysteine desulfurase NifS [Eubacteriales bacterium]|nr:cysteine desulfurase NifS [Eubacteriales bacterium]MDD3110303.1 cysteine desulfurase NifS [Eubacteriales bacterium]MDD3571355.1 cysteine desulfurase NifS [Eubacteriales bacterium]MDD4133948.1 cysteine desulfurase NifS [Eubacteriales bacterium]